MQPTKLFELKSIRETLRFRFRQVGFFLRHNAHEIPIFNAIYPALLSVLSFAIPVMFHKQTANAHRLPSGCWEVSASHSCRTASPERTYC